MRCITILSAAAVFLAPAVSFAQSDAQPNPGAALFGSVLGATIGAVTHNKAAGEAAEGGVNAAAGNKGGAEKLAGAAGHMGGKGGGGKGGGHGGGAGHGGAGGAMKRKH